MPMPTLQQIIGTITGKVAFERTQANFTTITATHDALETDLTTHKADIVSPHPIYAKKLQENWIDATLVNGWVNAGGIDNNAGYFKDEFSIVYLKGNIKTGTTTRATTLFTLPTGYIPSKNIIYPVRSYNGTSEMLGVILVNTLGQVQILAGFNYSLSLDGVLFRV